LFCLYKQLSVFLFVVPLDSLSLISVLIFRIFSIYLFAISFILLFQRP
jgi:hypothetical protein